MPLRDHFHPPLSERRPWESFHTTWASALADALNEGVLPSGFIALEQVHAGAAIEIDIGTFAEETATNGDGGTLTLKQTVWTPSISPLILPATFPESSTIEVLSTDGGRTLVAAIELVSPGNKDREEKRRAFAAKCATYLTRGIGLVVIDVVTSRHANMHNELVRLLGMEETFLIAPALYTVAYRPLRREGIEQIETWPFELTVGEPLPDVPLSLAADLCVRVDLESAYREACRRRHLDEVA